MKTPNHLYTATLVAYPEGEPTGNEGDEAQILFTAEHFEQAKEKANKFVLQRIRFMGWRVHWVEHIAQISNLQDGEIKIIA